MSAEQRVAIVTGAAGGIGRALVGGLLGQGSILTLTSYSTRTLRANMNRFKHIASREGRASTQPNCSWQMKMSGFCSK